MKNKTIDFRVTQGDGSSREMTLNMSENPTITYNGETYETKKPGEVLADEHIKNPLPLPPGVYGCVIDGIILIITKTRMHGLIIESLNPNIAVAYKGKGRAEKIIKAALIITTITFIILIITMGW